MQPQRGELGVEAALAFGVGEPGDPFGRGRERDAVAGQAGADRRARSPGGSCRCPGGPSRTTFSLGVQEVELAEVLDHRSS